jgi:hypothetical protein
MGMALIAIKSLPPTGDTVFCISWKAFGFSKIDPLLERGDGRILDARRRQRLTANPNLID